jgi:hypothetical protein
MHPCVTNLGLHGGAGLRFNLFEADRLARAGDVVVLAPEADPRHSPTYSRFMPAECRPSATSSGMP